MINLYGYCIFNIALVVGYVVMRLVISLPLVQRQFSQGQRLQFARYSFIFAAFVIFIGGLIAKLLPAPTASSFTLQPIIKIAISPLSRTINIVSAEGVQAASFARLPSLENILILLLAAGVAFSLFKHINNVIKLKRTVRDAIYLRRLKNIHIVLSRDAAIPFCWSLINEHYIVIPVAYIEKSSDLKLAIRHELQHIRQFDTNWLHIVAIFRIVFFCNPVIQAWIKYFDELQEFACDEALILRQNTSPSDYAQCLVDAASGLLGSRPLPQGALGINGFSKSILYRRVNMLFDYTPRKMKRLPMVVACAVTAGMLAITSMVFASSSPLSALSMQQVEKIIEKSNINPEFQVSANQAVLDELNNIRNSDQARAYLQAALARMDKHLPLVNAALSARNMPKELSVVPLVESGYQSLPENINPVKAAGIWQIIPATAKRLGLQVNGKKDERMEMSRATQAALTLLNDNYQIYKNWKLAFVAYEIGEKATDELIKQTGSRDAWVLANSLKAPATLKSILAAFDAELIILRNPALL